MRLFAVLAFSLTLFAQPAQSPRRLIVISIDGLDARFLSDPALRVKAPNLRRLMREGLFATVVGVAPSDTWPAHASLVTGVSPWQHGVLANEVPGRKGERYFSASSLKAPALWDVAAHAGMKTAAIYWPTTVGANVTFALPEYWQNPQGNSVAFEDVASKAIPASLADSIQKVFPRFEKRLWDDSSAAQAALYLWGSEKVQLLLVHFAELDAEQHDTGALSIYAREILESDDELIGQLIAKTSGETVIAIVSDHGFENANFTVRPAVMLRQAGVKGGVEIENGLIGTRDGRVAAHLRTLVGQGRKSGIAREVPMTEVRARAPELGRWIAAFDTLPNFIASAEDRGPAVGPGGHLGVHGLWPTRPGYRSVFILHGPGVRPQKSGDIDLLQIAPTLGDVLSLKLPAAKSASLWPGSIRSNVTSKPISIASPSSAKQ